MVQREQEKTLQKLLLNEQKTAEATRDLVGNKIANKINSLGKTKSKEKKMKDKKYIYHQKRQQIIDDLKLFSHHIKMEYQEITNL